jgi:hypothetical protein
VHCQTVAPPFVADEVALDAKVRINRATVLFGRPIRRAISLTPQVGASSVKRSRICRALRTEDVRRRDLVSGTVPLYGTNVLRSLRAAATLAALLSERKRLRASRQSGRYSTPKA